MDAEFDHILFSLVFSCPNNLAISSQMHPDQVFFVRNVTNKPWWAPQILKMKSLQRETRPSGAGLMLNTRNKWIVLELEYFANTPLLWWLDSLVIAVFPQNLGCFTKLGAFSIVFLPKSQSSFDDHPLVTPGCQAISRAQPRGLSSLRLQIASGVIDLALLNYSHL